MRTSLTYPALLLAALLALASVVSAAMMAPARGTPHMEAMAALMGPLDAELCGGGMSHEHPCPFCHGLPQAPVLRHDGAVFALLPHDGWHQRSDLHRAAQARNITHSPRAPPRRT